MSIATCIFDISKYLLTYLLQGSRYIQSLHVRDLELMHSVRGRATIGIQSFWSRGQSHRSWRIFIKQIRKSNISKNKRNSLWSFSSTSELRIISLRHVDRCQVLSTVDRRPSNVDNSQRPALCTARWRLGVMQRVARSVGVSQNLLVIA